MSGKASFIRTMPASAWVGHASMYELDPPYQGTTRCIVSQINGTSGPTAQTYYPTEETLVFSCDAHGVVESWAEIGGKRGNVTHTEVLAEMGYSVSFEERTCRRCGDALFDDEVYVCTPCSQLAPIMKECDPELEALLDEEERIASRPEVKPEERATLGVFGVRSCSMSHDGLVIFAEEAFSHSVQSIVQNALDFTYEADLGNFSDALEARFWAAIELGYRIINLYRTEDSPYVSSTEMYDFAKAAVVSAKALAGVVDKSLLDIAIGQFAFLLNSNWSK